MKQITNPNARGPKAKETMDHEIRQIREQTSRVGPCCVWFLFAYFVYFVVFLPFLGA